MLRRSFFGLLASIPFVGKAFGDTPSDLASSTIPFPIQKEHSLAKIVDDIFWYNKVRIERASFGKAYLQHTQGINGEMKKHSVILPWEYTFNDGDFKQTIDADLSKEDCILLRNTLDEAISRMDNLDSGVGCEWHKHQLYKGTLHLTCIGFDD